MANSNSEARAHFFFAVLKNATGIQVNWKDVATETGIKHPNNACTKFQSLLKQDGLKFANGALVPLNGGKVTKEVSTIPKKRKRTFANTQVEEDGTATKTKGGNEEVTAGGQED